MVKIQKVEMPDKILSLTKGDRVAIYVSNDEFRFDFFCDGTGNTFYLTKKEIREMLKFK